MSNYFDLIACTMQDNGMVEVFSAPAYSGLKKGDRVIVDVNGGTEATVERVYTVANNSDEFEFILVASGINVPLKKVLKMVVFHEFDYGDAYEKSRTDLQT